MKLYKYTRFDIGKQIISSSQIALSKPQDFNDPFDCVPVSTEDDLRKAIDILNGYAIDQTIFESLQEIKNKSGIDLWNETKLKRIDLTKDIETESDAYTMEVIRLSKLALHKTGYHLWVPKKEDIERTGWAEEDSAMFYNHNQEVQAKIYNKFRDFKNIVDVSDLKGLLRFELSLKRNFLKNLNP